MTIEERVRQAESALDDAWLNSPLPSSERGECLYHLLTSAELGQLPAAFGVDPDSLPVNHDGIKYALRSALQLAHERTTAGETAIYPINAQTLDAARRTIELASEYESAMLAFLAFHRQEANCEIEGSALVFAPLDDIFRHEQLDILVAEVPGVVPLATVAGWIRGSRQSPGAIRAIRRSCHMSDGGRITYRFNPKLARQLDRKLSSGARLIPENWRAWGFDASTVRRFLKALRSRCAYHVVAICLGTRGTIAFEDLASSLLLVGDTSTLVAEIAAIADLSEQMVQRMVSVMTYGNGTERPDPALQPIVPLNDRSVAVPCLLVLTSSIERNLLSLQTRTSSREFDSQSGVFETRMTGQLRETLKSGSYVWRESVRSIAGEIDVLMGDPDTGVVLVLELKWFLPPGDSAEVANRVRALKHGATQAASRVRAVLANREQFGSLLGLGKPVSSVWGAVLSDGFTYPVDEPCVPLSIFMKLLSRRLRVDQLADHLSTQPWLPRLGDHFEVVRTSHKLGGIEFSWVGHRGTPEGISHATAWGTP